MAFAGVVSFRGLGIKRVMLIPLKVKRKKFGHRSAHRLLFSFELCAIGYKILKSHS